MTRARIEDARRRALKSLEKITPEEDAAITADALADPDNPPADDLMRRRGRPPLARPKEAIMPYRRRCPRPLPGNRAGLADAAQRGLAQGCRAELKARGGHRYCCPENRGRKSAATAIRRRIWRPAHRFAPLTRDRPDAHSTAAAIASQRKPRSCRNSYTDKLNAHPLRTGCASAGHARPL